MDWAKLLEDKDKGKWFEATFDGGETSCCGADILAGDTIRADGSGGWEGECCDE